MADKVGGYLRPSPVNSISSSWNDHRNRPTPSSEPGTDYPCAYGTSIFAPEDGVVADLQTHPGGATGRYLTIDFNDGQRGRQLHLSRVLVSRGQRVTRGQRVAYSGASGFGKEWGYGAHVHQTLWSRHAYAFGKDATLDFERYVGPDNDSQIVPYLKVDADRQAFLNSAQGEKLVIDGRKGAATTSAYKRYQTYLQNRGWYSGAIDGEWGSGTQAGHDKRYAEWIKQVEPKPNPTYHRGTVNDLGSIGNVEGLQKIAKLYGYTGRVDNEWGPGSKAGLQRFLDQNYAGSLAVWLRSKWGYVGNDNWGPNMSAAAVRANAANIRAL